MDTLIPVPRSGPGVALRQVDPLGEEQRRMMVVIDGEDVAPIVYVAERRPAPEGSPSGTGFVTHYGWRRPNGRTLHRRSDVIDDVVRAHRGEA